MFTVIDKQTGNEIRTHDMFRVGKPFPDFELGENEQVVYIPELLLSQLDAAYDCTIVVDEEGTATAITITKTMAEWQAEQPVIVQPPTADERLVALEEAMLMLI